MIKLTVESLYGGGAVERFHGELEKAIANIVDPNTPAKKPRKVKLEMIIKPNEHRNMAEVLVTTSCSLQSPPTAGNQHLHRRRPAHRRNRRVGNGIRGKPGTAHLPRNNGNRGENP